MSAATRPDLRAHVGVCMTCNPLCADDCCLAEHAGLIEREAEDEAYGEWLRLGMVS